MFPTTPRSTQISELIRVLDNPTTGFAEKFWRETVASFPADVEKSGEMEDQVHWFFKKFEFLKEIEIIGTDEEERRKAMVLLGEKIKLLNQPVKRGSK